MNRLIRHGDDPPNAETPLDILADGHPPAGLLYVRCNFPVPRLDAAAWALEVDGLVDRPLRLSMDRLRTLPAVERDVVLECAGNGRSLMRPVPGGTPWGLGAAGAARFGGTPLRSVLELAGLRDEASELVFTGADRGIVEGREMAYAFSLEREAALTDGPLLAWEMNGAPLRPEHGYPVRVVVPGHYGMRSVKWLTRIAALDRPFDGHFRRRYAYRGERGTPDGMPVGPIRVRALITSPSDGARLDGTHLEVGGVAWSGHGPVRRVEVHLGGRWHAAELDAGREPARWWARLPASAGHHEIAVRATDAGGDRQPDRPRWNEGGYGNNAVHRIRVELA